MNQTTPPLLLLSLFLIVLLPVDVQAQGQDLTNGLPGPSHTPGLHENFSSNYFLSETGFDSPPLMLQKASQDRWFAVDKLQHVAATLAWTLSAQYVLEEKAAWPRHQAVWVSGGSAISIGLGKEIVDHRRYGYFSPRDLVADVVGIALGVGIILL